MSTDIQIISMVDDLSVFSVEEIDGSSPRALNIKGRQFSTAQKVLINDYGISSFTVISDTLLIAYPGEVLDSVATSSMSVIVLSGGLTNVDRVRLIFGPTVRLRRVTGLQKLVQQVVKVLLTDKGSNRFLTSQGGSLISLTSFPLTNGAQSRLSSALATALSDTKSHIMDAQTVQRGLSPEERLTELALTEVTFDVATSEVKATIRLATQAGNSVSVPLIL